MNKITLHTAFGLQDFVAPLANTRSLKMLEGTLLIFSALQVNKTLKINQATFG
ncbi:hypothetical protein [Holospora undulata]|uniref:hypothetical protein n=1 Tax=Holospora undulata TaxID=1169117 RepID=UPI001F2C2224|nr:hypothetical protein [Holospora undulata]